jgi:hypothetical protein
MAMEGSLFDTPAGGVLQTLGTNLKTGRLTIDGARGLSKVTIHYRVGQIIRIDAERRDLRLLLGYMLVQTGAITRDELGVALKTHKKGLRRLGDVLVESGHIDPAGIQAMVDTQARETLYQIFEWKEGHFHFDPLKEPAEQTITPLLSDDVLLEGYRRLDEWPLIRARVNNYRVVFRAVQSVSHSQRSQADGLPINESRILGLIDASRNVNELVDSSGIGEFETCKAVASLLTRGYIKAVSVKGAVNDPRGHQSDGGLQIAARIAWNVMLGALVLAGVWLMPGGLETWRDEVTTLEHSHQIRHRRYVVNRVRASIQLYRAATGKYPTTLKQLAKSSFGGALAFPHGDLLNLEYVSIGSDYSLHWMKGRRNG